MRGSRHTLSFGRSVGLLLLVAVTLAGCNSNKSVTAPTAAAPVTTPTPAPALTTPAPTPAAPTFIVTGTITETAPTATRPVEGAEAKGPAGTSTTTNASGAFALAGVPAGSHTLTFSRSNYESTSVSVTVTDTNLGGVQVKMSPSPRQVVVDYDAMIAPGDPACIGTSKPCDVYQTGAHHSGELEVFLVWKSTDADLDLELRCDEELVEESYDEGGVIEELHFPVRAGQACQVHVLLQKGIAQTYTIYLKYPY